MEADKRFTYKKNQNENDTNQFPDVTNMISANDINVATTNVQETNGQTKETNFETKINSFIDKKGRLTTRERIVVEESEGRE